MRDIFGPEVRRGRGRAKALSRKWVTTVGERGRRCPAGRGWRGDGVGALLLCGVGEGVFFVISGYLITSLLLRERDMTGEIACPGSTCGERSGCTPRCS